MDSLRLFADMVYGSLAIILLAIAGDCLLVRLSVATLDQIFLPIAFV